MTGPPVVMDQRPVDTVPSTGACFLDLPRPTVFVPGGIGGHRWLLRLLLAS
jgi:hypothetical protein